MNRYLVKIAAVREKEEFVSDKARAAGRGLLTAAGGILVGTRMGGPAVGLAAGTIGAYQGFKASLKNQRRENDLHNIKLEGAAQRREIHEARMKKMAEEHQGLKDAANTGVIAGLGGLGTLAASRLLKPGASKWATFGMGVGTGLVADYAGIKANKVINAKIDGMSKKASSARAALNRLSAITALDRHALGTPYTIPPPPKPALTTAAGMKNAVRSPMVKGIAIGAGSVAAGALLHRAYSALKSNSNNNQSYASYPSYGYSNNGL